jgi:two-component system, cell cycle sensor histidine kinase and response regulator CckA
MPGTDGITLACQITRERPDTRVLFMSGYTGHDAATRGLLSGDLPLLLKPFSRDVMMRALRFALDRPREGEMASKGCHAYVIG